MRPVAAALTAALVCAPAAASAAGDAAHGAVMFTGRCAICHSAVRGGPAKIGPNLFGVFGRKAAGVAGYAYSPAMQKSGLVWTEAAIRSYLTNPARAIPGNKMAFAGVANPAQLDDLVAYLKSLR